MSTTIYGPSISVGSAQLNNVYATTDLISQAASLPPCTTPAGTQAFVGNVSLVQNAPTYGTAMYFPGPTGNYMNFNPTVANFDLATNNMFVECWYYSPGAGGGGAGNLQQVLAGGGPTFNVDQVWGIYFYFTPNNSINFYVCNNAAGSTTATQTVTLNYSTWYHVAVSWIASTKAMYVFLNGQTPGTNTLSGTIHAYSAAYGLYVGADFNRNTCNGYVRDVRIIQGGTPPTAAFTPDAASAPFSTTSVPYGITGGQNIFTLLNQFNSSNNAVQITQWIQKTINKIAQPTTQRIVGTGVTFPNAALTSNNNTISQGTFITSSSTVLSAQPWQAFNKNAGDFWQSVQIYNVTTGAYSGTQSLGGVSGEWLQLWLPYAITLTSYTIQSRGDGYLQYPYNFTLIGSNDQITWTSLDVRNTQTFTNGQIITYTVSLSVAYRYYAIVVRAIPPSTTGGGTTSIAEITYTGNYDTTITTFTTPFWSSNTSSTNYYQVAVPNNNGGAGGVNGGWSGCVTIPDGRVIVAPQIPTSTSVGIFNPATNAFTTIAAGGLLAGAYTYAGQGVLAPDGRVIFAPFRITGIGIFNPATNSFTTTTGGMTAGPGYSGACVLPNGKLMWGPYDNAWIGQFDPTTNTYKTGPAITGISGGWSTAYYAGVAPLPDGRVVLVPQNGSTIGIYNYITNTFTTALTIPNFVVGDYAGGTVLPDGTVFFCPGVIVASSNKIGIYNPNTNVFKTVPTMGTGGWVCCKLLPNGLVFCNPYNTNYYGLYNYLTQSFTTGLANGAGSGGVCQGAGLLFDGRLVLPPFVNNSNMGIYTGMTTPAPREFVLHPLFNHAN